tara:strand:- start:522 stop:794 length:273 start_codon:yes stop_codon:yes gene_type:complete
MAVAIEPFFEDEPLLLSAFCFEDLVFVFALRLARVGVFFDLTEALLGGAPWTVETPTSVEKAVARIIGRARTMEGPYQRFILEWRKETER